MKGSISRGGPTNPKRARGKAAAPVIRQQGRPGLSSLSLPPPRFDLDNVDSFETYAQAEEEDRTRAASLRSEAARNSTDARQLRDLAYRIDPDMTAEPDTPASTRYMRDQRRRILGAVWQLFHAPRL